MRSPAKRKKDKRAVLNGGIRPLVEKLDHWIEMGDPMMKKRYEKVRAFVTDLITTCRPPADYTG